MCEFMLATDQVLDPGKASVRHATRARQEMPFLFLCTGSTAYPNRAASCWAVATPLPKPLFGTMRFVIVMRPPKIFTGPARFPATACLKDE